MLVMYTVICFSPLVSDPEIKFTIGYMCMFIVSMHLVVNFIIIGQSTYTMIKHKNLLRLAKKKH